MSGHMKPVKPMTDDRFPTLDEVMSTGGVAMNAPPDAILSTVSAMVTRALSTVPEGGHGHLVGIATKNGAGRVDVNLALAVKLPGRVQVIAWLGKSWGIPVTAGLVTGAGGTWTF